MCISCIVLCALKITMRATTDRGLQPVYTFDHGMYSRDQGSRHLQRQRTGLGATMYPSAIDDALTCKGAQRPCSRVMQRCFYVQDRLVCRLYIYVRAGNYYNLHMVQAPTALGVVRWLVFGQVLPAVSTLGGDEKELDTHMSPTEDFDHCGYGPSASHRRLPSP